MWCVIEEVTAEEPRNREGTERKMGGNRCVKRELCYSCYVSSVLLQHLTDVLSWDNTLRTKPLGIRDNRRKIKGLTVLEEEEILRNNRAVNVLVKP